MKTVESEQLPVFNEQPATSNKFQNISTSLIDSLSCAVNICVHSYSGFRGFCWSDFWKISSLILIISFAFRSTE